MPARQKAGKGRGSQQREPSAEGQPSGKEQAKQKRVLYGPEATMRDTIEWLLALPQPMREQLEEAQNYTFSMDKPAPQLQQKVEDCTNLATIQEGSVEVAALLVRKGFRPALLNFAHGYNCGGGFEHAGGSQEEDIFRKTSLFLSLWPHRRSDDGPSVLKRGTWIGDYDHDLPRKQPFYQHTECGGIYSPQVCVVRNLSERGHPLLDATPCQDLTTFAVLTVAAQHVGFDGSFNPKLLFQKARTILWMAASCGHDSVVLGAFGCGYFNNPPDFVAETFRELLSPGGEFENVFRMVAFAVIHGNTHSFEQRFPAIRARDLRCLKQSGASVPNQEVEIEVADEDIDLGSENGTGIDADVVTHGASEGVGTVGFLVAKSVKKDQEN